MRLKKLRFWGSGPLAVIGSGLGVYVAATIAFHWFIGPTVAKNQAALDPYTPPIATIAQYSDPPFASPGWSAPPTASISTSAAIAATVSPPTERAADTAPKKNNGKAGTERRSATAAVRSELPSRVASKRPTSSTAAAAISASTKKKTADTVSKKTTKKSATRPLGASDRRETSGTRSILPGVASNSSRQRL